MCADKNYLLEVNADEGNHLLTFTVKAPQSLFFKYIRVPLISVMIAYLVPKVYLFYQSIHDSEQNVFVALQQLVHAAQFDGGEGWQLGTVIGLLVLTLILISLQEQSDTLMVMEDMGVQLSSKKPWRFLNEGSNKVFIPRTDIIDIVIHEGFHGYGQVIFYMCILTKTQDTGSSEGNGIKVVFPNFLPRKDLLLQVWKQSRKMLYGDTRRHFRHVPGQGLREVKHLHE